MRKAAVPFLLALALAAPLAAGEADEGEAIFTTICPICHQIPEPSALKITQWRIVMKTMRKRMEQKGMEPLSAEEEKKVLEYLENRARK